jgi:hypothetical protein
VLGLRTVQPQIERKGVQHAPWPISRAELSLEEPDVLHQLVILIQIMTIEIKIAKIDLKFDNSRAPGE